MVNPKVYDPKTRDKLKSFLKQKLSQKFPLLSNYSLTIFKYNKFRLLEAHENPKLTISNGIAFIVKPGTSKVIEMNLEEVGPRRGFQPLSRLVPAEAIFHHRGAELEGEGQVADGERDGRRVGHKEIPGVYIAVAEEDLVGKGVFNKKLRQFRLRFYMVKVRNMEF